MSNATSKVTLTTVKNGNPDPKVADIREPEVQPKGKSTMSVYLSDVPEILELKSIR